MHILISMTRSQSGTISTGHLSIDEHIKSTNTDVWQTYILWTFKWCHLEYLCYIFSGQTCDPIRPFPLHLLCMYFETLIDWLTLRVLRFFNTIGYSDSQLFVFHGFFCGWSRSVSVVTETDKHRQLSLESKHIKEKVTLPVLCYRLMSHWHLH